MKIGIITIQKSQLNYGACLQCYALWYFVSSLGHDCEIIDLLRPCHQEYQISSSFGEHSKTLKCRLRQAIHRFFLYEKNGKNDFAKFAAFNSKVKYSKTYRSVEALYKSHHNYDVIISGSDQIWNPNMQFINEPYFLTFANESCKRISYASSFGIESISDNVKSNYRKWLSKYSYISTREESGSRIVGDLLGKKSKVVLDPVFLLKADEWREEMSPLKDITPKKYIFLYMLHYDERLLNNASIIAKEKQLPLYMVLSERKVIETTLATQLTDIGPAEWMWLIDNAEAMITSSFHAAAFSMIFRTPLVVFLEKGVLTNTRIEEFFSTLQIDNHICYFENELFHTYTDCCFSDIIYDKIANMRDQSIDFLQTAIKE